MWYEFGGSVYIEGDTILLSVPHRHSWGVNLVISCADMALLNPAERLHLMNGLIVAQQLQAVNIQAVALLLHGRPRARQQRRIRHWIRQWLIRRPLYGMYEKLMDELEREDVAGFRNFIRMDPAHFYELLQRLGDRITKQNTWYRQALEPGLKLSIALRYYATGNSYQSLMYSFRVAHNTISKIVLEVSNAIVAEFAMEVISCPTTPQEWRAIADVFAAKWQFFHVLGALDGKHVQIRCPPNGGSLYYNYKGFHSIILMALVDAEYKFIWIDVGTAGSHSDAQVFNHSELKNAIDAGIIGHPHAAPLPGDDRDVPFFLIGDDAFALRTWMMKPYSSRNLDHDERIFNYRLSRARRVVENGFGILANRFRCLLTTMHQMPETVAKIVEACICLHNLMRVWGAAAPADADHEDEDHHLVPGAWRNGRQMEDVNNPVGGNRSSKVAKAQRAYLKHYYNSAAGSVEWQERMIAWMM